MMVTMVNYDGNNNSYGNYGNYMVYGNDNDG